MQILVPNAAERKSMYVGVALNQALVRSWKYFEKRVNESLKCLKYNFSQNFEHWTGGRWSCWGDFQPDGVEVAIWFRLAANSEMWEAIHKPKEGLLNKKEPALGGFENSQSLQMANNAKIKKRLLSKGQTQRTLRKSWSKDDTGCDYKILC